MLHINNIWLNKKKVDDVHALHSIDDMVDSMDSSLLYLPNSCWVGFPIAGHNMDNFHIHGTHHNSDTSNQ